MATSARTPRPSSRRLKPLPPRWCEFLQSTDPDVRSEIYGSWCSEPDPAWTLDANSPLTLMELVHRFVRMNHVWGIEGVELHAEVIYRGFTRLRARTSPWAAWFYRNPMGPQRPWAWFWTTTRHVRMETYRSRRKRGQEDPIDEDLVDHRPDQLELRVAGQRREMLHEAISLLEEEEKLVVRARLSGMRYREISEETGIPVGALRKKHFKAKSKLRSRLRDDTAA